MLRCYFCTDLAVFECRGNLFCSKHRTEHDTTHTGLHHFTDSFCMFSKHKEAEFKNEINNRLNTLKKCKKVFAKATAEYIKIIQNMLSQKIDEIDKISQFYIDLLMKELYDRPDAEIFDKIFSTRLVLNPLENFIDTKFKDYILQEILESQEIMAKSFDCEDQLKLLSDEGKFLVEVLMCCMPKDIPEKMLRGMAVSSIGEKGWVKARGEVVHYLIVNIDEKSKLWSIDEAYARILAKKDISVIANKECLKYFAIRLQFDSRIEHQTAAKIEIIEMLKHAEKVVENAKIENRDTANILFYLGTAYNRIENNTVKAEKYYLQSLKINEKIIPERHPDRVAMYINLGDIYKSRADYNNAEYYYLQCLNFFKLTQSESHTDQATLYMKLGNLYDNKADYDKAEKYYLKCLEIHENFLPEFHSDRVMLYISLGDLYRVKEDNDAAENYYLQCLKIQDRLLPEGHLDRTCLYMSLGIFYKGKGNYKQSEYYYLQCLKIREKILPDCHPDRATLYMNIGTLYHSVAEYETAEKYYLMCLKIQEQIFPESHPDQVGLYMNLAILFASKKSYDKAENYFLQCLKICEQFFPENHSERANIYMILGIFYTNIEDYEQSQNYNQKCIKIREQRPYSSSTHI